MPPEADGSLDGKWQLMRAEMNGEPAHELLTTNTVLELHGGSYTVRYAGEIADQGTFELGGTSEPPTLKLRGQEGPNAGRTIPCIYQRVGDRLRICYGLDGVAPTRFGTESSGGAYLAVYRRSPEDHPQLVMTGR